MDDIISRKDVIDFLVIAANRIGAYGYLSAKEINDYISNFPSAIDRPDHGYMWICPECGLPVHSDHEKCPRCGWVREPETVARDIANILENEQDMRVILKNAEDETVVTHCDVKENAELIAQIMDCDVDGEAFLTRCRDCKYFHLDMPYVIQGIPVLGHKVCDAWGDGCKTDQDGYCFMAERR